jgi:hypothetical protein
MNGRFAGSKMAIVALSAMVLVGSRSLMGQAAAQSYVPPRTANGQPDLGGIWQVLNSAAWNIEDHSPSLGSPGGVGVVEGGSLPYLPAALAKRKENVEKRPTADPEASCYLPGVPRATYMPYPIEIVQFPDMVMIFHEYLTISRQIFLGGQHPDPDVNEYWMGDSRGRWDGNTLVVDVSNFNDRTWFDRAGNFHSDALHLIERFTPTDRDHLSYDVSVEDPKVFSRPWKMSMPLYRRQEKNVRLLEYDCYAYMEEEAGKGNLKLPWTHFGFEGTPEK